MKKVAILGAGLTGLTIAKILSDNEFYVDVYEKELGQIGGMCYEEHDKNGLIYSKYGPHIFHTNNEKVMEFVKANLNVYDYEHKVKSLTDRGLFNWPINYNTMLEVFKTESIEDALSAWEKDKQETTTTEEDNFENKALKSAGKTLYNLFIKQYTETQWGRKASELPSELFGRIRIEESYDDRFFKDKYVVMPHNGFNELFNNLSSKVKVHYAEINKEDTEQLVKDYDYVISTIPPWVLLGEESLEMIKIRFVNTSISNKVLMFDNKLAVMNLCNNDVYTRVTNYGLLYNYNNVEAKYITEEPHESGIPLYPIRTKANIEKAESMINELKSKYNIISVGRLGTYKYLNMDEAILQAMEVSNLIITKEEK